MFRPDLEDVVTHSLFLLILNHQPKVTYFNTNRKLVCTRATLVRICNHQSMTGLSKVKQTCVFTLLWAYKIVGTLYLRLHFMCWKWALPQDVPVVARVPFGVLQRAKGNPWLLGNISKAALSYIIVWIFLWCTSYFCPKYKNHSSMLEFQLSPALSGSQDSMWSPEKYF